MNTASGMMEFEGQKNDFKGRGNRIRSLLLQKPLGSLLCQKVIPVAVQLNVLMKERSWHRLSFPFPEMQQQRRCQVQLVMASNLWTLGQSVLF
jgi:hypothetical protein